MPRETTSKTPWSMPSRMTSSMARSPLPWAWNGTGWKPACRSISMAGSTQRSAKPKLVMPTTGLSLEAASASGS